MKTAIEAIQAIGAGFVEAALFSSSITLADGSEFDGDLRGDYGEISRETAEEVARVAARFYAECGHWVKQEPGATWESAGQSLWFTLAGHGCGFWDGSWPKSGANLSRWCDLFPNIDAGLCLYVDGDGLTNIDGLQNIPSTTNQEG